IDVRDRERDADAGLLVLADLLARGVRATALDDDLELAGGGEPRAHVHRVAVAIHEVALAPRLERAVAEVIAPGLGLHAHVGTHADARPRLLCAQRLSGPLDAELLRPRRRRGHQLVVLDHGRADDSARLPHGAVARKGHAAELVQ